MKKIRRESRFKKGPTARERVIYTETETNALISDGTLKAIAEAKLPTRLQRIAAECWRVLQNAGLPCDPDEAILVRKPVANPADLEWRTYTLEEMHDAVNAGEPWPPAGWTDTRAVHLASSTREEPDFIPHDSIEGYACRILRAVTTATSAAAWAMRHASRGNDTLADSAMQLALNEAIEAGELYGEARFAEWFSGSQRRDPNVEARHACIEAAAALWEKDPNLRIGEAVARLQAEIPRARHLTAKRVREWLKDAHATGDIEIPSTATRRGRPRG